MLSKIMLFSFIILVNLFSQTITVRDINPVINTFFEEYYHPQFSPDDSKLLLTKSNFYGLYYYDLKTGELIELNDMQGAGYKPVFSDDGQTVYYRSNMFKKKRLYYSIIGQNIYNLETTIFEQEQRNLSVVTKLRSGKIIYSLKERFREIQNNSIKKSISLKEPFVIVYKSRSILILEGNNRTILQPLGKKLYLWPSVSPDGSKLLFTVAGQGTFISDLDGNILYDLGWANAPEWSPDGEWIVFMRDYDDGYRITASDIFIFNTEKSETIQLTDTPYIKEMYPHWSHSGLKIACSTATGSIYVINLERNIGK